MRGALGTGNGDLTMAAVVYNGDRLLGGGWID